MRSSIRNVIFFLKVSNGFDLSFFLFYCLKTILDSFVPFIGIYYPSRIIYYISNNNDLNKSVHEIIIFFIISIVSKLVQNKITYVLTVKNKKVDYCTQKALAENLMNLKYYELDSPDIMNKLELAKEFMKKTSISDILLTFEKSISNFFVFLGTLYIISYMGVIIIPIFVVVLLINVICENKRIKQRRDFEKYNVGILREIQYQDKVMNDYHFAKDIRLFNMQKFIIQKYKDRIYEYKQNYYKTSKIRLLYYFIGFAMEAVRDYIVYAIVCIKFLYKKIGVSEFYLYTAAISKMYMSINSIFTSLVNLNDKAKNIEYLKYFFTLDFKDHVETNQQKEELQVIKFDHVYFKYSQEYVLKDICLEIHSKDKIGIVGENGGGKSTLIKLLLGLYQPTKGKILFNGKDINEMNSSEYMDYFSVIFQDNLVLPFSVYENILFLKKLEQEKLNEVLRAVDLTDKVKGLQHGLDTNLSKIFDEDGVEFSGGEQQQLMLARALCKDAAIHVYDEPTSALSAIKEKDILCSLEQYVNHKTIVFISHRLAFCLYCDNIIVLHNGEIVEEGNHQDLMNEKGRYYEMFSAQSNSYK